MEIYSVRSSSNFLFKNNPDNEKNSKAADFSIKAQAAPAAAFHIGEDAAAAPDFTAISPSELRGYARQGYDTGTIDQDTYAAISEPLPMHAIDPMGNVIDLSDVTDGTSFNFRDYYKDQLQIAMSIGDPESVKTLKSVVSFLDD